MIGGPSFREPDEGGVPCPDCLAPTNKGKGGGEYDRELIAKMLDELEPVVGLQYIRESVANQARLLRAAENRDAAGVRTVCNPPTAPVVVNEDYTDAIAYVSNNCPAWVLYAIHAHQLRPAQFASWLQACEPYLKDDETPAQCIERNRKDVDAALELLRQDRAKNTALNGDWVLASERKPPEDVPVWCSIDGGEPWAGTYSYADGDEDGSGWAWMRCDSRPYMHRGEWTCYDIEWDDQYDVTHWMPLPMPPIAAAPKPEEEEP
jgi:hypothetical protein